MWKKDMTKLGLLAGGAVAGFLMALLSIWLVIRRQARAPARELLASGSESESRWLAPSGRKPTFSSTWPEAGLSWKYPAVTCVVLRLWNRNPATLRAASVA